MNDPIEKVGDVLIAACILCFLAGPGFGQEASKLVGEGREPLSRWSRLWLDEVVPYIITGAEKDVFLNLRTEEERGKFIEAFWKKRDPDPGTPENELKLDYYRRIALANKFLGAAGLDGWRTDRGKIYILLGPPSEIQTDLSAEPKETWNYWGLSDPGLPYNLEFTFVDWTATGHYVLENSLNVAGQESSLLDPDSLHHYFDRLEHLAEATRNPFENLDKLRGVVTTQVSYDRLPLQTEWLFLKGKDGQSCMTLVVGVPQAALKGKTIEGRRYYSLTMLADISDGQGRPVSEKTRDFNFQRAPAEVDPSQDGTFVLRYPLGLKPGSYKLHLLVLDNFTGRTGTYDQEISVPDFDSKN